MPGAISRENDSYGLNSEMRPLVILLVYFAECPSYIFHNIILFWESSLGILQNQSNHKGTKKENIYPH